MKIPITKNILQVIFITWGVLFSTCLVEKVSKPLPYDLPTSKTFIFYPIQTKNGLIIPTFDDKTDNISCIDPRSGERKWKYTNTLCSKIYYNFTPVVKDTIFLLPVHKAMVAINLNNGTLLWKSSEPNVGENHVYEFNNIAYRTYRNINEKQFEIIGYDIKNGQKKYFKSIPSAFVSESILRSPIPFETNNKTKLVAPFIEYNPTISTECNLIELNLSDNTSRSHELYPNNSLGKGTSLSPILDGANSYWVSENNIIAFDHQSFVETWKTNLPKGLLTSRLAQNKQSLFVPCEDGFLYSLNKANGHIQWKTEVGGTPSKLFVSKAYVFVIGGSNQKLHQVDIASGTVVKTHSFKKTSKGLQRVFYINEEMNLLSDGRRWYGNSLENDSIFAEIPKREKQ